MRVLVISDLHANLQATEAVLADAASAGWTRALVLGDIVGYGADPAAVIDTIRALPHATLIRGNHDKAVAGIDSAEDFNPIARDSVRWTTGALDAARLAWLRALPAGPLTIDDLGIATTIAHGAPFDEDYYLFDADDASHAFDMDDAAAIFVGHTHLQMAFTRVAGRARSAVRMEADVIPLATTRVLINPGAVGQPRDGDPRAAYALLDAEAGTVELRRVAYDISEAQRRIRAAGLHSRLAERLSVGR